MERDDLIRLIKKFVAGNCTPSEKEMLERWWDAALHNDTYKDEVSQLEREMLKQKSLRKIQSVIRESNAGNVRQLTPWYKSHTPAIAACLSVFILATIALLMWNTNKELAVSSKYGERIEFTLPDGSTVVLNGNSRIRYSDWADNEDRHVWLEGEAFFAVRHTENHNRFIVNGPDSVNVQVLGTQFSVNNRSGETNVILREGKVRLEKASQAIIMKPNEMVSYSRSARQFRKKDINADQQISWKDNVLIFQDETFQEIAVRLKASHNINIIFRNAEHANEVFNGSIPGDSVSLLFEKIEKLYAMTIRRDADGNYIVE